MKVTVSIVVAAEFGDRLEEIAKHGPVWIVDTPTNRSAAERWWNSHHRGTEHEGVTTFKVAPGATPEQWCLDVLPTVDLHYGAYDENPPTYNAVDVWGAVPTPALIGLLAENGCTAISRRPDGFRASRGDRTA